MVTGSLSNLLLRKISIIFFNKIDMIRNLSLTTSQSLCLKNIAARETCEVAFLPAQLWFRINCSYISPPLSMGSRRNGGARTALPDGLSDLQPGL